MNCNSNVNERYRKSVLTTVNVVPDPIMDDDETTLFLGCPVYQSGTALEASDHWHKILRKGLYRVDASVTFVPATDGIATIRILLDGKELPVSRNRVSVRKGEYCTITTCVPAFDPGTSPSSLPRIEVTIHSVAGCVDRTMLSTTKLA